jgi:hypothetical protein
VLVCETPRELREYAFEVRSGELVETRRRVVGPPLASAPTLLEVGPDLLLLANAQRARSSRAGYSGQALLAMRLVAGASEWSRPTALTIDLDFARAVCAHGDQVTVAWSDDRFQRVRGLGFVRGKKLCIATSPDRGATWSSAALLQDPDDERAECRQIAVLDDGARLLVADADDPTSEPGAADVRTYALSRDLARWSPEDPATLLRLAEFRREQIARLPP